jgi:CRP/FNR family cyclic AMP-dependent transcriptional regulator
VAGSIDPEILRRSPVFAALGPAELDGLTERLRERAVPAGGDVVGQEGPLDEVFVLVEGSLKVYRRQEDGSEVILRVLGPGEIVGELSATDRIEPWAGVAALEDSRLLRLDGDGFRRLIEEVPAARVGLIDLLCRRVRVADERISSMAALDVEGRVACTLLGLARRYGEVKPTGGTRIPIPLTQADLAAMTGASRVRVNQVISKFRSHGWVTLDGRRRLSVQDPSALEDRCR